MNFDKTYFIQFTNKSICTSAIQITYEDKQISIVIETKFLGLFINNNLSWNTHIEYNLILIGDSNIRGYASTLKPLLNSNYNLYSVVKPGSGTNELKRSANEAISQLTHDDMIILCYGINDLDLKNQKNSKKKFACTFQSIKNFIMNNNHTNILLMNIPLRYDIPN